MSERPQLLYCQDILDSGEAILSYVQDITCDAFVRDRMRYSAVIREFEIIGEAVGKLSPECPPTQIIRKFDHRSHSV